MRLWTLSIVACRKIRYKTLGSTYQRNRCWKVIYLSVCHLFSKTQKPFLPIFTLLFTNTLSAIFRAQIFIQKSVFIHKKYCISVFYSFLCFCRNKFWKNIKNLQHDGEFTENFVVLGDSGEINNDKTAYIHPIWHVWCRFSAHI